MEQLPRFLTIRAAARELNFPEFLLRKMCKEGTLPGFYAGKKFMINFAALCEQLDQIGRSEKQI